jgi:N-methylhydantoinase B
VLDDVLDDYVSIESARREYGVVIAGTGADLSVDEAATRRLRAAERSRSKPASERPSP